MAVQAKNKLSRRFAAFFVNINPSNTYQRAAASAHASVRALIEDLEGPASDLRIKSFLQGSYRRDTAIHTINDVDVVALCSISYVSSANRATRDWIFDNITAAIATNATYRDKIACGPNSTCIKVVLDRTKVEILPALRIPGRRFSHEPFYMFDPHTADDQNGSWRPAFARRHHELCSEKNSATNGLFIPMIKCIKHLRSIDLPLSDTDAVSYHIECLLYAFQNSVYTGSYCECLESILSALVSFGPDTARGSGVKSPSRDKVLFSPQEWAADSYRHFHDAASLWHAAAHKANQSADEPAAVECWQALLGNEYFPATVE